MVTADGEEILARYDDWAISFLRQKKLIWSSWGAICKLASEDHTLLPDQRLGFRRILGVDSARLRLFFLSVLWRAATTSLFEFKAVSIAEDELSQLRQMVFAGEVVPYHFFPITLIQLSPRSFPHNRSAGLLSKREPMVDPITGEFLQEDSREVPHYRFYFDGLIAHLHIGESAEHVAKCESFFVEPSDELLVTTVPSEESAEMGQFWQDTEMPELLKNPSLFEKWDRIEK
ncbi:hypothetical protein [Methylocella sp.]|uniref:hypothetical protein n=1 Tax=Methylocella sp. TaxID=1978226 RepID=UPI003C21F716